MSVLSKHGENFERFRLNKASGQNLSRSTLVFVLLYLTRVMLPSKTQISIQCHYAELREKDFVIRQGRYSKLDSEAEETKLWSWMLSDLKKNCGQNYSLRQVSKKNFIFRLPYLRTWKFRECFRLKIFCQEFGSWWTQHIVLDCSSWPLYSKDDPC